MYVVHTRRRNYVFFRPKTFIFIVNHITRSNVHYSNWPYNNSRMHINPVPRDKHAPGAGSRGMCVMCNGGGGRVTYSCCYAIRRYTESTRATKTRCGIFM